MARYTSRPIRPNPLIATRTVMRASSIQAGKRGGKAFVGMISIQILSASCLPYNEPKLVVRREHPPLRDAE
jgi:hypothetical protein